MELGRRREEPTPDLACFDAAATSVDWSSFIIEVGAVLVLGRDSRRAAHREVNAPDGESEGEDDDGAPLEDPDRHEGAC